MHRSRILPFVCRAHRTRAQMATPDQQNISMPVEAFQNLLQTNQTPAKISAPPAYIQHAAPGMIPSAAMGAAMPMAYAQHVPPMPPPGYSMPQAQQPSQRLCFTCTNNSRALGGPQVTMWNCVCGKPATAPMGGSSRLGSVTRSSSSQHLEQSTRRRSLAMWQQPSAPQVTSIRNKLSKMCRQIR